MIDASQIQGNLYELYADLGTSGLVDTDHAAGFDYIMHSAYAWPNMCYRPAGTAERPDFVRLLELMKAGRCPRLVLFEESGLTPEIAEQIKAFRFVPAAQWTNLFLPVRDAAYQRKQLEVKIVDVDVPHELSDWTGVASEVLFKNAVLDEKLFAYGGRNGVFRLITGYFEERPACTTLLYLGNLAGIYMVATLPAFQGRGFGNEIMQYAASVAALADYSTVVLHSTRSGIALYDRLGFQERGKLLLYYCMS